MDAERIIYHVLDLLTNLVMIGLLQVIYTASRRLEAIRRELGWIRVALTSMRDEATELPDDNGRGEAHEDH